MFHEYQYIYVFIDISDIGYLINYMFKNFDNQCFVPEISVVRIVAECIYVCIYIFVLPFIDMIQNRYTIN